MKIIKWLINKISKIDLGLIPNISIRNLVRQKRRNITLGVAIAVGVMVLVLTNSFSKGITDIIFNQMLVYSYGHVNLSIMENGQTRGSVVRDKDRFINIITNTMDNVKQVNQYTATFTRVIGNGKAGFAAVVGLPSSKELIETFTSSTKLGKVYEFTNTAIENPLLIYENKAKDLNVKLGDKVNIKLTTINGQAQTARLTVVAIMKTANLFQSMAMYIPISNQKALLGYKDQESGPLQIVFKKMNNPNDALKEANKLYAALTPNLIAIPSVSKNKEFLSMGFYTNSNSLDILKKQLNVITGSIESSTNSNSVMVSTALASKLGLGIGSILEYHYGHKFDKDFSTNSFKVTSIFNFKGHKNSEQILVSENNLYKKYYADLPTPFNFKNNKAGYYIPGTNENIYKALAPEWKLLKRTSSSIEYQDKLRKVAKERWEGGYLDVSTMFEFASFATMMESVLNIITVLAVFFVFSFVLIGLVNALRMSIRERTREIGTNRAIGMQGKDVRNTFILETFFLGVFACMVGIIGAYLIMGGFQLVSIETDSFFSMFLMKNHLHFIPSIGGWRINLVLLILFSLSVLIIENDYKFKKGMVRFLLILGIVAIVFIPIFGAGAAFAGKMIPDFGIGIMTIVIMVLQILVITAYFPSSKAAELSAADALRHYE